jgi:hypothetical protein
VPQRAQSNRNAARRTHARRCTLPLALLAAGPILAAPLSGELEGDVSAGYDSNPAQSHEATGLAFARYVFAAVQPIGLGGADVSLGASGFYTDYEAANDNYRFALNADWSGTWPDDSGVMTLSAAVAAYRDALVPADARNEAALTLRYERILTARDSLNLTAEIRQLAYIYPSLPWAGRPGSGPSLPAASQSGRARGGLAVRRTDLLSGLGIDVTHAWSPTLTSVLSAAITRCNSPVPVDAYVRSGAGFQIRAEPAVAWSLELGLGWSRTAYDRAPQQQERVDNELAAGLTLRRTIDQAALFCSLDWINSQSTIATRAFRQQVTQCGLSWSF